MSANLSQFLADAARIVQRPGGWLLLLLAAVAFAWLLFNVFERTRIGITVKERQDVLQAHAVNQAPPADVLPFVAPRLSTPATKGFKRGQQTWIQMSSRIH